MPTTRPRHLVTESDELKAALDEAAARWPSLRRSALLVRLALEGHRAAQGEHEERLRRRLEAVDRSSGALSDIYDPDSLRELREDWPE